MQPFTLDQAIITALLFLLGVLIGMFLFAGRKWKRRYQDEATRVRELEAENARLGAELREGESLRHAATKAPVHGTTERTGVVHEETRVMETPADPYRRVAPRSDGDPDIVIRRT